MKILYILPFFLITYMFVCAENYSLDGFEFGSLHVVSHDVIADQPQISSDCLTLDEGDLVYILSANSKPLSIKYNATNNANMYDYEYTYALFDPYSLEEVSIYDNVILGYSGSSFTGPGKIYAMSFYDSKLRRFWNSYSRVSYAILRKHKYDKDTHLQVIEDDIGEFKIKVENHKDTYLWKSIEPNESTCFGNERCLRLTFR